MDELLKDPRFAHIPKDPKFRRIPKSERKVKIDKRFKSMFTDKRFTVKYTIDKRGRPINQSSTEDLKKFYDLSSSEEDDEDDNEEDNKQLDSDTKSSKTEDKTTSKQKKKVDEEADKKVDKKKKNEALTELEEKIDGEENENRESEKKDDEHELNELNKDDKNSENDDNQSIASDTSTNLKKFKISKTELEDNENQLKLRRKNEINSKIDAEIKKKLKDMTIDYARGEGALFSDSSSDEESSVDDDEDDEEIEHNWGELDKEAETTEEVTKRLAVCNMDWDRIRAVDLMVLFNSFLPPGGFINSVTIYPSEFGLQRMKEEEIKGPIELVENKLSESDEDENSNDENEEGSSYHMEKMRQYQLNRLKYYYAVVEFNSAECANKIYTECDGIEYESTATKLDLRFIPDDMEFDQEPKDFCDKLPEVSKYQPRQFTTTALQQVKVDLTWDETKPERMEINQKLSSGKIDEVDDNDIQAYLASGTSDDESDNDKKVEKEEENQADDDDDDGGNLDSIEKYKLLLKSIEKEEEEKKNKDVELEFTWGLDVEKKTEKLVKERMKKAENLTPFEQFLEKRKEKQKAKRDMRKNSGKNDFSNEEMSESEDSIPSDVDINDPYFAEELKGLKSKNKDKNGKKQNKKSKNKGNPSDDELTQKKSELELLMLDEENEGKRHFDMKKIEENELLSKSKKKRFSKKKKLQKAEADAVKDDFEVNVEDPRFGALFQSHHYNIDPADPHYRKTKGTEALIREKLKRRADYDENKQVLPEKSKKMESKMSADLAALVKSVKKNTKNISKPIK